MSTSPADPLDAALDLAATLYARPVEGLRAMVASYRVELVALGGTDSSPTHDRLARVEREHALPQPGTDVARLVTVDAATALAVHMHRRAESFVEARAREVIAARAALEKTERALADAEALAERCAALRDEGLARAREADAGA